MQMLQPRFVPRVTLGFVTLVVCAVSVHAVEVISGPTLTMDPNGKTPLAGVVELETDVAVTARLIITDGSESRTIRFADATQQHYLPVLGLKPDRTYTVDVHLTPGGPAGTLFATTLPLPADFPVVTTLVSIPALMEPGYTLIDRTIRDPDVQSYSLIVDNLGEVVWYTTELLFAVKQMPNGNLFYRTGNQAVELDLLANETRIDLQDPGIGLHHDLIRTPHGTYLGLNRQLVDVLDFPTSETDPAAPTGPATLVDDSIVEFLPDGTLRREWPLLEMIDPTRIGYDSLLLDVRGGLDWTHANAVTYRLEDDSIIVSIRHQDAVIKFSRETGALQWILGPHDNWSPEFQPFLLQPIGAPFRWQFHQHAPMWTGTGSLLLFDNGNHRASPFDGTVPILNGDNFSRGVEFEIDEDLMEVQQLWEYGEDIAEPIYSGFICDADLQETTGNRLMNFGAAFWVGGVRSVDLGLGDPGHTRIVETTNDLVPVEVFSLTLSDPAGGRLWVYRSERIPSLYPLQGFSAPNGVGSTVIGTKQSGVPELTWATPSIDAAHDAADYYVVYSSSSPSGGFIQADSTATTSMRVDGGTSPVEFFKLVAANIAGTSGDEPAP